MSKNKTMRFASDFRSNSEIMDYALKATIRDIPTNIRSVSKDIDHPMLKKPLTTNEKAALLCNKYKSKSKLLWRLSKRAVMTDRMSKVVFEIVDKIKKGEPIDERYYETKERQEA